MRIAAVFPLVLLVATAARADEKALIEILNDAMRDPYGPSGRGGMERALKRAEKEGGPATVRVLAKFIQATFNDETAMKDEMRGIKKKGRVAFEDIERLKREIAHLKHRESAGATGLGPQITKREVSLRSAAETLELAKNDTFRLDRLSDVLRAQRDLAASGCSTILSRLDSKMFAQGVAGMRSEIVVEHRDPSLLVVHMLRRSGKPDASSALLEIFSHPKTQVEVRVEAACAVASLRDKESMRTLVDRLLVDKAIEKKRILHALSRAAGKKLATLDDAKTWLAS